MIRICSTTCINGVTRSTIAREVTGRVDVDPGAVQGSDGLADGHAGGLAVACAA